MAWNFVRSIYTYQLYNNSSEKVKHPHLVTTCFHVQLPCIVDRNIQYETVKWIPPFHKPVSHSVQYRDSTIQLVITPNPSLNFFTRYGCGMDIFPAIPFFSFSCHILGYPIFVIFSHCCKQHRILLVRIHLLLFPKDLGRDVGYTVLLCRSSAGNVFVRKSA